MVIGGWAMTGIVWNALINKKTGEHQFVVPKHECGTQLEYCLFVSEKYHGLLGVKKERVVDREDYAVDVYILDSPYVESILSSETGWRVLLRRPAAFKKAMSYRTVWIINGNRDMTGFRYAKMIIPRACFVDIPRLGLSDGAEVKLGNILRRGDILLRRTISKYESEEYYGSNHSFFDILLNGLAVRAKAIKDDFVNNLYDYLVVGNDIDSALAYLMSCMI